MMHVLLAEDNPGDVLLIREALRESGVEFDLTVRKDGELMLSHIEQIDRGETVCPDVVLLDLNLPKTSGHALLERIRSGGTCKGVPVIIVTSSDSFRDRDLAVRLGANAYFRKACDYEAFMLLGDVVKRYTSRS